MSFLYILTAILLMVSLLKNPGKTMAALRTALRRFVKIAPAFIVMIVLVAVFLYLVPENLMVRVLARENKWEGMAYALGAGSVSVMPGFIAFPLCGILRDRGALYMILSAFSTSLMMVGIVSFSLEKECLGLRLAVARNVAGLVIAVLVAIATGFFFGELP
jgi:uncharacterized membrane protein YraQ (UPF0718 family)